MRKQIYVLLASITLLLAILYGCKTPRELQPDDSAISGSSYIVTDVKRDYEAAMSQSANQRTSKAGAKAEKTTKRKIRWEEAYTVKLPDGEKMIVPFSLEDEIFFYDRFGTRNAYSSFTFFITSKKGNKHEFELATFIPEYPDDISKETEQFSGEIIIEDISGNFVKAYLMNDGKLVGDGVQQTEQGRILGYTCRLVEYWSCAQVPSIGYYAPCHFMYNEYICYYTEPTSLATASNGYLQLIHGGTGHDNQGNSPYYPFPDRLTRLSKGISNLTQSQKATVNETMDDLINKNCAFASLYVNLVSNDARIKWTMDPTIVSVAVYQPSNQSISFKSSADINEHNLQEEMFHRYQDAYYQGGSAQYNPAGLYNIEFEAALLRDLSNLMYGWPAGQAVIDDDYYFWLMEITEDGTKWPTQWSHISEQYYYYLGKYVDQHPGLAGGTGLATYLEPQALLMVTRSSNCPRRY